MDNSRSNLAGKARFFNKRLDAHNFNGEDNNQEEDQEAMWEQFSFQRKEPAMSEANLQRRIQEAARTIKKYPHLQRKANTNMRQFAEEREYMSAYCGA